jgi:hypothetical protein
VTKVEQPLPHVERLGDLCRYGTIMKSDKIRVSKLNLIGVTFARFKLQSVTKKEGFYLANIEIINDDIPKDV